MKPNTQLLIDNFFMVNKELVSCKDSTQNAISVLIECFNSNKKLIIFGNGGSSADAQHIAGELMKGFIKDRQINDANKSKLIKTYDKKGEYIANYLQGALRTIALGGQTALESAYINDAVSDMVYAQQVYGLGDEGDVLLAISTSGNSENIINAVMVANSFGIKTIGLTGSDGGKLKQICDICINASGTITYKVQELHIKLYHMICMALEEEFF